MVKYNDEHYNQTSGTISTDKSFFLCLPTVAVELILYKKKRKKSVNWRLSGTKSIFIITTNIVVERINFWNVKRHKDTQSTGRRDINSFIVFHDSEREEAIDLYLYISFTLPLPVKIAVHS